MLLIIYAKDTLLQYVGAISSDAQGTGVMNMMVRCDFYYYSCKFLKIYLFLICFADH